MLHQKHAGLVAILTGLIVAATAGGQVLIGGFQGPGDPTDAGWINVNTGNRIVTDSQCSFPSSVVPGYAQSLQISVPAADAGKFGYPCLKLDFSAAQIAAFYTNSWITFTFSVPAWNNNGFTRIYNLALNAPGYGYHNQSWANALEMGGTSFTIAGQMPNFYFDPGISAQTMSVTYNYSSVEGAIQAGISNSVATNGLSYLQMTLQGNQGGGAPLLWYLNKVELSQTPFGEPANIFVVDDFPTNGVGPQNPVTDDFYTSSNNYTAGQITNVWGGWFGSGGGFSNLIWSASDANSNPASGSMEIQLNWTQGGQFAVWEYGYSLQGLNNNGYMTPVPGVSSLTYTSVEMDVRWDPSSVAFPGAQAYPNYGPLRIGERESGFGQNWLLTTNIAEGNTNWIHIVAPLSPSNPEENGQNSAFSGVVIGADTGGYANSQFVGPATLYVDNIELKGPLNEENLPPRLHIQPATPGLRIFAGSFANTYDREDLGTVSQSESWVGGHYPVTYSFSLLSYPNNNINKTMLELIPVNTLPPNDTVYQGNEYMDYQASNGLWLVLAPNGGGSVTACVEWKTNDPSANPGVAGLNSNYDNPNFLALEITNSTALGTWTLTFNGPGAGSLTPPAGVAVPFTILDPAVSSDFANPMIALFGLQPNSTAGEGLYEDWGFIGITNVAAGNQFEDFTRESSDFYGGDSTPSGLFEIDGSANPASLVITLSDYDKYWVSWTSPAINYALITSTNVRANPGTSWVNPAYYSDYNDDFPPRGAPIQLGIMNWLLLPSDDLPTINGQSQANPPNINNPLNPSAFFILSTNAY